MEKVICDICGSEFDESLEQCPICGCAKKGVSAEPADSSYVKGGRFSKSNVRRRMRPETGAAASESVREYVKNNDERNAELQAQVDDVEENEEEPRSNRPLVMVVILLLLAIIAVSLYIIIAFGGSDGADDISTNPTTSIQVPDDDGPCTSVMFSVEEIKLDKTSPSKKLTVLVDPVNTQDVCTFESSDPSVVVVDDQGNLTALKKGVAVITVRCGNYSDTVNVISEYEETTIPTTQPTTQPTTAPNNFIIPSAATSIEPINVTVKATNLNVRQGPGTSYDIVGEQLHTGDPLTIYMEFVGSDYTWALSNKGWVVKSYLNIPSQSGSISLNRTDFTLTKNDSKWNLYNGDVNASEVTWTSSKTSVVTVSNGIVTAVGNGSATITASYNGQELTCKVYVTGF